MARHLDKDPATYTKERDGFVRDLHHFHDTRGTPFRRPPIIGGQEVDLFLLYSLVTQNGGWMKVNSKSGWNELLEKFDLPNKCVNGGIALKQVYIRFLDRYEKVHFLGEEAERGSDDDDESRHKRWSARALHSVSLNYNYHQHNIVESARAYNGLSTTLHKQSDYDRLALSLISPLPNEQDFAVNVCTLMCNEGKHTLRLDKCPRLIDYLLAHTGVFNHVSLRTVFTEVYTTVRKHPLNHFWYDVVESRDFLDLINENNFTDDKKKSSKPISPPSKWRTRNNKTIINGKEETKTDIVNEENRTENDSSGVNVNDIELKSQKTSESDDKQTRIVISDDGSDSELFASETPVKLKLDVEDKYLFCTGSSLGTQDFVGQRVLQIANILRNLSFTEDNVTVLAANRTFLRFLLLCVSSRWNSIHQLGLDMLGNIAAEIILKEQNERLTDCLIKFVTDGLHSPDRVIIIACLEILNKLSQREANEEFMLRILEKKCYLQVCSFLTLHDVMLLIYTLECLYSLSSLGERACNFIVEVHGIIDTLVSLVTVEGKSYGPKACIGMKLVETVPGITTAQPTQIQQVAVPQQQQTTQMPILQQQPLVIATSSSSSLHITTTPSRPTPPIQARNIVVTQHKPITPQIHTTPVKQTPTSIQSTTPTTAQHVLQQQHAHQQAIQENEQFALAWLRATYEPCGHGRIEQQELYKQYLNSCTKIGRRGVIAPLHFPRCVRSVFGGTVGPNPVKNTDPPNNNLLFYEGIRPRIVPLIITLPSAALQQTVQNTKAAAAQRRKPAVVPVVAPVVTTTDVANADNLIPNSPASPILKAQLSAPPKPRDSPTKPDNKSQVLAHPHLSQALLGTVTNSSPGKDTSSAATSSTQPASTSSGAGLTTSNPGQSSSSSLIKSLLATKVNDCMLTPHAASSIKPPAVAAALPATDAIMQVAQRQQQQRLLAQQNLPTQQLTSNKIVAPQKKMEIKSKNIRPNGIRLSDAESSLGSDTVSSTSSQHAENHYQPPPAAVVSGLGTNSTLRGRREPPQPPPPPLAPLSVNLRAKTPRMDIEDSDSTGNNSVAVSSTEDGDNSLTSFEGILLNGIPHSVDIDAPYTEDSNSKDSIKNIKSKPLMLADLLEKKVEKDPPILNGVLCKELRIGDKGLELVDNHINQMLSKDNSNDLSELLDKTSSVNNNSDDLKIGGVKRSAEEDISDVEAKKINTGMNEIVVSNSVNGVDSPQPESIDSNGDDANNASVSATAANLYASLAADVLEDEDEELLMQQEETPGMSTMPIVIDEAAQHNIQQAQQVQVVQGTPMHHQVIVTPHGQGEQLIMAQRQIIVSQGQIQPSTQQLVFTTGGQFTTQTTATIKTPTGHQTVLVQTPTSSSNNQQQRPQQMMISQAGGPPIHLVQHGGQMQQVQLVQAGGTGQPQTVMIQTPGTGGGNANQTQYVIAAQQQTALVQGQPQTVLVAQTPQQHGTPTKTIIILQSQPPVQNTATHHQKVVVTPQGQPVVVTQVQRPMLQSSSVSNIPSGLLSNAQMIQTTVNAIQKPIQATVITQNSNVTSPPSTLKSMSKPCSRPQTPIADTANGTKTTPTGQTSPLPPPLPPPPIIKDINHPWVCEWRGCTSTRKFRSANEVYMHACEIHCSPTLNPGDELQCLWDRCDTLKRKRFSLMTHLHDRHCSPEIMKAMAVRRRQLSQAGKTEISTPAPPPPHPGYAPDAALHAIKRHALEFVNPKELQDDNEGPVTKSIRLTASLILRNLVIFSNSSRRYLRHYEPHLAGVALSNVESSRTIAQLLYDLSDTSASRR